MSGIAQQGDDRDHAGDKRVPTGKWSVELRDANGKPEQSATVADVRGSRLQGDDMRQGPPRLRTLPPAEPH